MVTAVREIKTNNGDWLEGDIQFLKDNYKLLPAKNISPLINKSIQAIRQKAKELGIRKKTLPWTERELEYLNENYGLLDRDKIAKRLKRSPNALKIIAYRKMQGLNQRSNIYTARSVAELFGIPCSKTVTCWMEKGFIKGKRAPFFQGRNQVWNFQEEDIMKFVKTYPYFLEEKRMEPGPWRQAVRDEYIRDPWYTASQAAKLLGIITDDAVHRYIRRGWLKAVKRPVNIDGEWIIRKSAIDAFLANDRRKELHDKAMIESRRKKCFEKGVPIMISRQWELKCCKCGQKVTVVTDPNATGPDVKAAFERLYIDADGNCFHGGITQITRARHLSKLKTSNGGQA